MQDLDKRLTTVEKDVSDVKSDMSDIKVDFNKQYTKIERILTILEKNPETEELKNKILEGSIKSLEEKHNIEVNTLKEKADKNEKDLKTFKLIVIGELAGLVITFGTVIIDLIK